MTSARSAPRSKTSCSGSRSSCAGPNGLRRRVAAMRPRPERLERLPEQYFTRLLARVSAAAALDGETLVDLGRGNPDVPPPEHVVRALAESAARSDTHG